MQNVNIKLISIEGNIGSGKSTCLSQLHNIYSNNNNSFEKYYFLQEPVEEWNNIKDTEGNDILTKFYEDQTKYSFSFQMMAYISRLAQLKKTIKDINCSTNASNYTHVIFTERSLFTDKNVFAKMLFMDKKIDEINYQIYNLWFSNFIEDIPKIKFIYIKTDPDIAYERVLKRNRNGENITKEYIINCHKYHNNWLETEICAATIDGNGDINYVISNIKNVV